MKLKKLFGLAMAAIMVSSCAEKYEYPFQNPRLSVEERTENLISLLQVWQKQRERH